MSIIYEALQKTQLNRKKNDTTPTQVKTSTPRYKKIIRPLIWIMVSLAIIGSLSILIRVSYHAITKHQHKKIPVAIAQPPAVIKPKPVIPLVLNGVFVSENYQLAEINHHYYRLGDTINNMKIVAIEFNAVKLQDGTQQLTLQPVTSF